MNIISFVVDKLPLHYYQAELLLYSLEQNTDYQKKDIIVQCLSRVDKFFLDCLDNNGYRYNLIEPYLDGKYCNKLQQLEYFKDKKLDINGVILMDTDMFVVDDISNIKGDEIIAKIVDYPNPNISTLKNIYKSASLFEPEIVKSDCDILDNNTFENNFNGGFYYIPKKYINDFSNDWKKWGKWLYNQPELFTNKNQFIHVDQISFSLVVHSNNLNYQKLSSNYNFPIHFSLKTNSFNRQEDIKIIHYHREIDDFGLLNINKIIDKDIKRFIHKANKDIIQKDKIELFKQYKKSLIPKTELSNKVIEFEKKLEKLTKDKRLNLILHSGTPKTGTTSLQFFMNNNFDILKSEGYLYPKAYINTPAPKHQWIVSLLMSNNFDKFFDYILDIYNQAILKNTHTIILSTEGVYNHWWDYSPESKLILKLLGKYFNLKIWVFFREPISFFNSLYRQYLKNPQINLVDCYGKNLSFSEMLKDKWFIKHLDYLGFIYDCEDLFGEDNIKVFNYSKDIIKDICEELDIKIEYKDVKRENIGQSEIAVELLRVINQYKLNPEDKAKVVKELFSCDKTLGKYSNNVEIIDNNSKKEIEDKFHLQYDILKNNYNFIKPKKI